MFSDHIPFLTPFLALFACLVLIHRLLKNSIIYYRPIVLLISPLFTIIVGQGQLKNPNHLATLYSAACRRAPGQ